MATQAKLAKGIQLKRGDGASPEVFTTIPEMLEIPESPAITRDLVDVTNQDSPGTDKEYILGLGDGNEITAVCNYIDSATQEALRTDKENGTARNFQLLFTQFTPTLTASFTALVRSWTLGGGIGEAVKLTFVMKITGAVTWA